MGDRYYLELHCIYCNHLNNPDNDFITPQGIYYAPTSGIDTFQCENCKKHNFINADLKAMEIERVTFNDIKEGFDNTSMGLLTEEDVNNFCRARLKSIKEYVTR